MRFKCYPSVQEARDFLTKGEVIFALRPHRLTGSDDCVWLEKVRRIPKYVDCGRMMRRESVDLAFDYEERMKRYMDEVEEEAKKTRTGTTYYPRYIPAPHHYQATLSQMIAAYTSGNFCVVEWNYEEVK